MKVVYHSQYVLTADERVYKYSSGEIESISLELRYSEETPSELASKSIAVHFRNSLVYKWDFPFNIAYIGQFGVSVSHDGKYIFVQSWESGLCCLNSQSGEKLWRTKSKRGITSVFVNKKTLLCCQHERAIQLLDISSGAVIKELRTTAYDFTAIDAKRIVCHIYANKWCIIDADSLDILQSFSQEEFTGQRGACCVNSLVLLENTVLRVSGFREKWDYSSKPTALRTDPGFTNIVALAP